MVDARADSIQARRIPNGRAGRRVGKHHGQNTPVAAGRDFHSDLATHRDPDESGSANTEMIKQADDVARAGADLGRDPLSAAAVTSQVWRDHSKPLLQLRYDVGPHDRGAAKRMQ